MNRQEKEQLVQTLKQEFKSCEASFLVDYKGLTVAQLGDLRKKLRAQSSDMLVAKVTLVKRAVAQDANVNVLTPFLQNQVALVFVRKNESSAVAKTICDFTQNSTLNVVAGYYDSVLLDSKAVKQFAKLPPREVLLAQVAGVLKAPIAKFARVCQAIVDKQNASQSA